MVSIDIEVSAYLMWLGKKYPLIVLQSDQNFVSFTCRSRAEISSSSVLIEKKSIASLPEFSYHHHPSLYSNAEILEPTMYLS